MLETQRLAEERQHGKALANVALSRRAGVAAAALGRFICPPPVNESPEADQLLRRAAGGCAGGFVADALLEVYERHESRPASCSAAPPALKHHLRTDRSLSLSEDLPLITVAVDTRPRIEAVSQVISSSARPGWSPWSGPGC